MEKLSNRAGCYKVNLENELKYQSFKPSFLPINPPISLDEEMMNLLVKCYNNLNQLNSISSYIPNINLFISMYVRKEALMSSQIEGTQATLEDVLNPKIEKNKNLDVEDVVNYIKATNYALERLDTLPLCNRLIKETHSVLLNNVRGQEKNPGEFRSSQNWIGGKGSTLKDAKYIPPNVEDMKEAMSNLEKYLNNEDDSLDKLIQIALIHYQFETIHPFLDGNGRIGRLLIILYLIDKKILNKPSLYISYYLKKNRTEYYDRMSEVRKNGNYEQWVKFFLTALIESSNDSIETINELEKLHNKNIEIISSFKKAKKNMLIVFKYLEENPIIDISKTASKLSLAFNTVSSVINTFIKLNIVSLEEDKNRNRTFIYKDYLDILRKGTD